MIGIDRAPVSGGDQSVRMRDVLVEAYSAPAIPTYNHLLTAQRELARTV